MSAIASSARIDPRACVEDGAVVGENVSIGPFAYVGPKVRLGDGVTLMHHAVVSGATTIGPNSSVFPMAVIGGDPQSVRHDGSETTLDVGANCIMREGVTMNTGSSHGGCKTVVGDNNLFLANSHVGHDCILGSHIILSNNVMVGGHVEIADRVILSGGAAIHQFVRIGRQAFVGGLAGVVNDVVPYAMIVDNPAFMGGLNVVGMTRSGMARADVHAVRRAYKAIFADGRVNENASAIRADFEDCAPALELIDFVLARGERGLTTPGSRRKGNDD
ncbi:acyl-ACP--UDP-N-acetylglucosamine O-acyltransferase [Martelella alba]|uniref:Acyl-ACP--UDP-N-acetylglucosamine O-acyltransferase n=1 Tax=Martelella alba TaxID=2590451 RepID=A0A506UIA4_9HYPH|nr:acyl-ACP--UDP-N-acetylglucosamine O-acyltransferase [Martelella alba]TPW33032.1 acyl-ACP--UDP-N-acetylglucosamine O-acyltransferase [Martelella alba]